jgi:AcrR family transcriptional regulator
VGVDEIGKVSGISGSAIYRHFPSKDAILAALFDKTLDTLLVRLGESEDDPAGDVEKLIRAFVTMSKSHERPLAVWLREQRSLARQYRMNTTAGNAASANASSALCSGAIPTALMTSWLARCGVCNCCLSRRHCARGQRAPR